MKEGKKLVRRRGIFAEALGCTTRGTRKGRVGRENRSLDGSRAVSKGRSASRLAGVEKG